MDYIIVVDTVAKCSVIVYTLYRVIVIVIVIVDKTVTFACRLS